jgi:hypothetical protein
MNYPFECDMAGGVDKHLLYMEVRSPATGRLLATWTLGVLKTAEGAGQSYEATENLTLSVVGTRHKFLRSRN